MDSSSDDFSTGKSNKQTVVNENVTPVEVAPLETAKWTRHLPEAFGLRETIRASKFRWCARESGMWGIATGTAMSIHRMRMGSSTSWAINVGFFTVMAVMAPTYYFCVKRREYQEQTIELMMRINQFPHASYMPEETPLEEHPFEAPGGDHPAKEFRAFLKEKKHWQQPDPTKDFTDVFDEEDGQ